MSLATGGKVWKIPEPAKPAVKPSLSAEELALHRKNIEKRNRKAKTKLGLFMLFAIVLPFSAIPTIAYFLLLPLKAAEPKTERENFAGGFITDANVFSHLNALIICIAIVCVFIATVYFINHTDELYEIGAKWNIAMVLTFSVIYTMPIVFELANGTASESINAFENWAKGKYALNDIEKIQDSSTVLKAETQNGDDITFNILRKDDIVYLYETDEQLVELTQRIAKGPDA